MNTAMRTSTRRRPRQNRRRWFAGIGVAVAMLFSMIAVSSSFADHTAGISGVFESADGNLAADHPPAIDWNSFTDEGLAEAWNFTVVQDRTGNPDDIFGGGTNQADECPNVREGSLGGGNSKFDLDRLYLATQNIQGDEWLFLAWIRVPSSPSASSHIAYEFNKADPVEDPCPNSDLPKRTDGDLLVIYDFEGGEADSEVRISRWTTSGECENSKRSAPCWGPLVDATGSGFADAEVNAKDRVGDVFDAIGDETLVPVQFGEASINLTEAGVFAPDACEAFGSVTGVSRASGNSAEAQMKDKVGPADFRLANCGSLTIVKETDPAGAEDLFDFTIENGIEDEFSLADGESKIYPELFADTYTVTEDDPSPDWKLVDITCTGTENFTVNLLTHSVSVDLEADDDVTCTFTNEAQRGAIEVTKTRKYAGATVGDPFDQPHPGVTFEVYDESDELVDSAATGADGTVCFDDLALGDYTVVEIVPAGYVADDEEQAVSVTAASDCDGSPATASFHNSPLTDVTIEATSQDPDATRTSIVCVDSEDNVVGNSGDPDDPALLELDELLIGVYTCTIDIDP